MDDKQKQLDHDEALRRAKTEAREETDPDKAEAIMDRVLRPDAKPENIKAEPYVETEPPRDPERGPPKKHEKPNIPTKARKTEPAGSEGRKAAHKADR